MRSPHPVRVLIVDDNALFRDGLATLLETSTDIEVVGVASSGAQAVHRAVVQRPDVVLMDLATPGMGGVAATRQVVAAHPDTAVCILTASAQATDLFAAIRAGARGYLVKNVPVEDLAHALHTLAAGGALVSPHLARELVTAFQRLAPPDAVGTERLTVREREILSLAGGGLSNQEIADRLMIAANTVKVHLRNILDKLRIHSRAQAAAIAAQAGLVPPIHPDADTRP